MGLQDRLRLFRNSLECRLRICQDLYNRAIETKNYKQELELSGYIKAYMQALSLYKTMLSEYEQNGRGK